MGTGEEGRRRKKRRFNSYSDMPTGHKMSAGTGAGCELPAGHAASTGGAAWVFTGSHLRTRPGSEAWCQVALPGCAQPGASYVWGSKCRVMPTLGAIECTRGRICARCEAVLVRVVGVNFDQLITGVAMGTDLGDAGATRKQKRREEERNKARDDGCEELVRFHGACVLGGAGRAQRSFIGRGVASLPRFH